MVSSTASEVDEESPSRFEYHERDGMIWGDYFGDTVTVGKFLGTRVGDILDVSFVHALVTDGSLVTGSSTSTVVFDNDGIRLVENFVIDGEPHVSVCVEELTDLVD